MFRNPISCLVLLHERRHVVQHGKQRMVGVLLSWVRMLLTSLSDEQIAQLEQIADETEPGLSRDEAWESVIVVFGLVAATRHCLVGPACLREGAELRLPELTALPPRLPW